MRVAAGIAFCIVFGSLFWRAATEPPAAQISFPQCGVIGDDAERSDCFAGGPSARFRKSARPDESR